MKLTTRLLLSLALLLLAVVPGRAEPILPNFLKEVPAASVVEGADGYGAMRDDIPVAPVLKAGETVGWAFITSDFVSTTGSRESRSTRL